MYRRHSQAASFRRRANTVRPRRSADGLADDSALPASLYAVPSTVGDAVDALDGAGVAFESLAWSEPSLEDVYLRLTGEEYSPREGILDEAPRDGGDR